VTDRPTASTITDDELDALYAERDQLASLAVNAANALRDERRHYRIACEEVARLRQSPRPPAAVDWSKVTLTAKYLGVLPAPDPAAPLRAVAAAALRDGSDAVLRQSPQTAAAAVTPSAPRAAPGARVAVEHPSSGVSGPSGGEIGAQTGAQSLAPDTCTARYVNYHMQWACDRPTGHPGGHSSGDRGSGAYQAWTDQAAGASPAHAGHGSPCEDSPDGTCAAPAPPADQAFSRLREEAPPAGALRDQIAEVLMGAHSAWDADVPGTDCELHEYLADAVLPVIEQHTARLRETDTDGPEWYGCRTIQHCATFGWCRRCAPEVAARAAILLEAVRKTRLDESKVAEVYQVIAKAMRDTQQATLRARALHADTERRLTDDLAAEVRKREAAEAEIQRMLRESPWLRARDEEREDAQAALAAVRGLADDLRGVTGARYIADALDKILTPKEHTMSICNASVTGPHVPDGGAAHCTRNAEHPGPHTGPAAHGHGDIHWTDQHAGATPHDPAEGYSTEPPASDVPPQGLSDIPPL
jgi:hypothetical protein